MRRNVVLSVVLCFLAPTLLVPRAAVAEPALLPNIQPLVGVDEDVVSRALTVGPLAGGGLVVATSDAGYELNAAGKVIRTVDGHPPLDGHANTTTISLGSAGFLALLRDTSRGLGLAMWNAREHTWQKVDRPLGFVPGPFAISGDGDVVFPQKRQAWFVFRKATRAFEKIPFPESLPACFGSAGALPDGRVASVGTADGRNCAVALDAAQAKFHELPDPPRPTCGAVGVTDKKSLYLLGGRALCGRGNASEEVGAMQFTPKSGWKTLPDAPFSLSSDTVGATAEKGKVATWRFRNDRIELATFHPGASAWQTHELPLRFLPRAHVRLSSGAWAVIGKHAGGSDANRTVLLRLEVDFAPSKSDLRDRDAFLATTATKPTRTDWSDATADERRKAVREGLASVERWIPATVDPRTRKKRKMGVWVFSLGDEAVSLEVPPRRCEKFIADIQRGWPTRTVGSRDFPVELGENFARHDRRVLYDVSDACNLESDCDGDFYTVTHTPLSLVGPVLSVATLHGSTVQCEVRPTREVVTATDVTTGKPVPLSAVVSDESLFVALSKTRELRPTLADATDMSDARTRLAALDPNGFETFAFLDWKDSTQKAALRIYYTSPRDGLLVYVDVWIDPKPAFIPHLEAAQRGEGFTLSRK